MQLVVTCAGVYLALVLDHRTFKSRKTVDAAEKEANLDRLRRELCHDVLLNCRALFANAKEVFRPDEDVAKPLEAAREMVRWVDAGIWPVRRGPYLSMEPSSWLARALEKFYDELDRVVTQVRTLVTRSESGTVTKKELQAAYTDPLMLLLQGEVILERMGPARDSAEAATWRKFIVDLGNADIV